MWTKTNERNTKSSISLQSPTLPLHNHHNKFSAAHHLLQTRTAPSASASSEGSAGSDKRWESASNAHADSTTNLLPTNRTGRRMGHSGKS